LKNDAARQWEGFSHMMENKKHVPNHQPDYTKSQGK
jgi:hypothetical protein